MKIDQNMPSPDVNTFIIDDSDSQEQAPWSDQDPGETVPVPPDQRPTVPVEEPPGSDKPPIGDVDDSPKKIAQT